MKKSIAVAVSALFVMFALSSNGFAQSSKKKTTPTKSTTSTPTKSYNTPSYSSSSSKPLDIKFSVSGPLTLVSGTAYWGVYVNGVTEMFMPNLYVGAETGFSFASESAGGVSATSWILPLLPTVFYPLELEGSEIKPFVGASLGIAIASFSVAGTTLSSTKAYFEGYLHLGGTYEQFLADIRLGVISSSFVFAPTVGIKF